MTAVFDSYAWIEYFSGSGKGAKVKQTLEMEGVRYTPAVCLTEIKNKYLRNGMDPEKKLAFIRRNSVIVNVDDENALKAADYMREYGLHTVDAIVYACSRSVNGTLLTGDKHFKGLPDVELV